MPETQGAGASQAPAAGGGPKIELTPELVEKITARVYAMLLADARIERERLRLSNQKVPGFFGGRHAV